MLSTETGFRYDEGSYPKDPPRLPGKITEGTAKTPSHDKNANLFSLLQPPITASASPAARNGKPGP